jgi:hypothetical protein
VRINADDLTFQLIEEHGLQEAYQRALKDAVEALKLEDNYSLSVMREVKASLRSKIDEQINAAECKAS